MKIGVYSFTFDDWREKDYPLDLWIEWNCKLFDEVSLFYIGDKYKTFKDIDLKKYDNLTINGISGNKRIMDELYGNRMYAHFKELAQNFLFTDWKLLLDIDEFVTSVPNFNRYEVNNVYGIYMHVLFGDVNHEISPLGESPVALGKLPWGRLAYGMNKIIEDGSRIEKPVNTDTYIHVYHTTLLRNGIEIANRTQLWQKNIIVDPNRYKEYWPKMELLYIEDSQLPEILKNNKNRFNYLKE
ncbi:MAG: hypothetical protein QXL51_05750 [Candidatus Aenigmatarchaeota archaeon]